MEGKAAVQSSRTYATIKPIMRPGGAVEAEDDKALLMLLDKRCAELVEGEAA